MTVRRLNIALEEADIDNSVDEAPVEDEQENDVSSLVNETETDKLIKAMKESLKTGEHTQEYQDVIASDMQAIKDENVEVPSSSDSSSSSSDSSSDSDSDSSDSSDSGGDFGDMDFGDDSMDDDTADDEDSGDDTDADAEDGGDEDSDPVKKPDAEESKKSSSAQESFRSTSMDVGKYLAKRQRRIALEASIYEAEENTKMDMMQHKNERVFMDGQPLGHKIVNYAGNKMLDAAGWAKDKIVEHGPGAAKGIFSLVVGAGSLVSDAVGGMKKWAHKKFNSFASTKKNLNTLSQKLDSYLQAHPKSKPTGQFSEEKHIPMLKIGNSVNIINNIGATVNFTDSGLIGVSELLNAESENILRLLKLDRDSSNTKYVGSGHFEKVLEKGSVDGYSPKKEGLVSYVSSKRGMGDVRLMAYIPDPSITNVDKLKSLYGASSMFLAMDVASVKSAAHMPFVGPKELSSLIAKAIELTDLCIAHEKLYKSIDSKLNTLSNKISEVGHSLKKLDNNDMEVASNSMEYVYMKMAFINKVYIPCAMDIHEYNIKVLHALVVFIERNLKALND